MLPEGDDTTPIPGASTVDEVVGDAIANLADGPTWFVGEQVREGVEILGAMPRNDAVRLMAEHGSAIDEHHDQESA